MALTFTSHGDLFGSRADEVSIALCAPDLGRVFAITTAGFQIKYYSWDLAGVGFAQVNTVPSAVGGANLVATFGSDDRLLAAFNSGGATHYRAFDDSLNTSSSIDAADISPGYIEVALAGIPPAGHPLSPGAGIVAYKGSAPQPSSSAGTNVGRVPYGPQTITANTKIVVYIGPRICYAASAAVTQGHQLAVGVWGMDWDGKVKTKIGQTTAATTDSVIHVSAATVSATWEDEHLKKADFVTAVQMTATPGPLKLIRWRRDSTTSPAITKLSETVASEQVEAVTAAPITMGTGPGVVTAVIDASGNLKVIGWKLGIDGSITRGADASGEAVSMVRCAWVRNHDVVTAVKLADGTLKLIYWRFPDSGPAVRLGEKVIHTIGFALSVAHRPGTGNSLGETIVATNLASGDLKMLRFSVTET